MKLLIFKIEKTKVYSRNLPDMLFKISNKEPKNLSKYTKSHIAVSFFPGVIPPEPRSVIGHRKGRHKQTKQINESRF